jgi:hypothetical protein
MKEIKWYIIGGIAAILVVVGLAYFSVFVRSDLGPRSEAVERKIFVETPSYVNGKINDLSRMRRQYKTQTDPAFKKALKEEILTAAETIDPEKLPADIRQFVEELKAE